MYGAPASKARIRSFAALSHALPALAFPYVSLAAFYLNHNNATQTDLTDMLAHGRPILMTQPQRLRFDS